MCIRDSFNADGTLDSTFGTGGIVTLSGGERLFSVRMRADGKIVVGGDTPFQFYIAQYNADGTLDTSFGTNGSNSINFGNSQSGGTQTAYMACLLYTSPSPRDS